MPSDNKPRNNKTLYSKEQLSLLVDELHKNAQNLMHNHPDIPYSHFVQFSLEQTEHSNPRLDKNTLNHLEDELLTSIHQILKQCRHLPMKEKFDINNELAVILHAQQLPFRSEFISPIENLCTPRVTIIGAGLAGLLAALVLARAGIHITIYEARNEQDARLRPQNISFKEAEIRLRPILGDYTYHKFFQHGGTIDGNTGKLRISTGTFQDILTQELANIGIYIQYEHKVDPDELKSIQDCDSIIVTTGVHACERLSLQDYFNPVTFPEFSAVGRTALCIRESNDAHGYSRNDREGYHWRRDNISIYSGKTMELDLIRMVRNIQNTTKCEKTITKLRQLIQCKTIEYSFIFGNNTERFFDNFPEPLEDYVIQESTFKVHPMLALTPVSKIKDTPIIAFGDANGSPHPLAAIGTLKFLRNVTHLQNFIFSRKLLQDIAKQLDYTNSKQDIMNTESLLMDIYSHKALTNNKEVFFGNVLSCIYSMPRSHGVET